MKGFLFFHLKKFHIRITLMKGEKIEKCLVWFHYPPTPQNRDR